MIRVAGSAGGEHSGLTCLRIDEEEEYPDHDSEEVLVSEQLMSTEGWEKVSAHLGTEILAGSRCRKKVRFEPLKY